MSVPFARRRLALDMVQKFLHHFEAIRQNHDEFAHPIRTQFPLGFLIRETSEG